MSFIFCNVNPEKKLQAIDCTVRAIATARNTDWETEYIGLATQGYIMGNMPSANEVWHAYLRNKGFVREAIPNTCPDCYTVKDFCKDFSVGVFILGTGSHVIAVIDGNYYDTWDSGDEVPVYFWRSKA